MAFRVGQRVVCVKSTWLSEGWQHVPNKPIEGSIYTVRGFQHEEHFAGVLLDEVVNRPVQWAFVGLREISFPIGRFRPVVERKTDIAIFQAMLNPSLEDLAGHILDQVMS